MNFMRPTRLLLFRHGEVDGQEGVFYSQNDVSLSENGIRQASEWASALKDRCRVSLILSSDLSRCMFQAELLARAWGCEVRATKAMREVSFGEWAGLTWDEIERRYPGSLARRMADLAGYRPPGGENLEDVRKRAFQVVEETLAFHTGETVAIVGHGGVNRVIIAAAIGLPLQNIFVLAQDFGCLNILDFYPDGPVVLQGLNLLPSTFQL